jgi:hypothetical protein
MDKICKKCASDPMSHSFKKISEKGGVLTYYTQPSQGKLYDDKEGILLHVDNALKLIGNRKWRCIVNGDGFDMKHAVQVTTGSELLKLFLEKYGEHLEEVKIINPSWHIMGIVKALPMMISDPAALKKVKILDDRVYSILEFV